MNFKHEDTQLLVAASVLLIGVSGSVWWQVGADAGLWVAVVLSFAGLVGLSLNVYRTRVQDDIANKKHVQALLHLFSMLDMRRPIPALTEWAASPQLACSLVSLVKEHKPAVILEVGSGSSTLVLGYAVEQSGGGRVIALDHLAPYGEQTRQSIERHELGDYAEVRDAPLVDVELEGDTWPWYDLQAIDDVSQIDMMVVDGPPHKTRSNARYPAVPLLANRLSDDAVVVLDDAYRDDEAAIAAAWAEQLSASLTIESSPYGTAVLRRAS